MIVLNCGNCAWFAEGNPPPSKEMKRRGFCTFYPPKVFPMPKQTSTLQAMGKQNVQMVPMMLRPVVEEDEPMCGKYHPDEKTLEELKEEKKGEENGD